MVRADPICTAIHFAPILVLLTVHCSSGRWPTDADCAERVMRYGFSVALCAERPASVLTHLFVHISSKHLLSNVFSFAATLAEFGDVAGSAAEGAVTRRRVTSRDDEEPSASGGAAGSSAAHRMASEMRAILGQRSRVQACVRSAGALFVWAVGGAAGGLGCQMLYNNFTLALRRQCAARAAAAVADAKRKATWGASDGRILASLSRVAEALRQRAEACNSMLAVSAQEAVNDAMLMCGASAGICALSGFSAAYYGRFITAFCLVVPEALLLTKDLINRYIALLAPSLGATDYAAEAERRALRSTWRILVPVQSVGHAAHVGGFMVGLGMGYCWLWVRKCRRLRLAQSRRRAAQWLPRPGMQTYVHARSRF
ncbi:putative serine peptidase, Clan S-, family S54 [Leishmania infantum JPCM5]|uniref:Serine_peptidase_-_Clan_S-_-_family_S54_-_putative n=2 Tax=Leishmania infantum TaxID=5671 RepID=A0A6L0WH22_LEIIN|nr:putative serine peptidase, Clan S-, family S54 [Leishmania infantum JPCM5]CAC9437941.1 serine_peptidase_-_Clan_S-_-_family_S54_-_putative [Leishmania infantum]CAM65271.1 putative serine peptidase, Clan S-, family S54 [Leishmania infantum JPCM5]SUZ38665.1 serine_peptidase_-_Clan_S-_-_family_S54_-_putative [Leishmania infantum]|eukprot:XP_001462732.1 putative serine peptidase, Clan S-, family S54 [Leishmania infantum JPCM5]